MAKQRLMPAAILAVGLLAAPLLAGAQSLAPPATGPLIIDQNRLDRARPTPPPPSPPRRPAPVRANVAPSEATALTSVTIEGSSLADGSFEGAWRPFVGQKLTAQTIAGVTEAVAAVYVHSPLALYTVDAQGQDLSTGVLHLRVVEGYVSDVAIDGADKHDLALVRAYAGRLTSERPLRKATLQRVLSLIRDIPGLTLVADMAAGDARGAAQLRLTLKRKPVEVAASVSTRGTQALGRDQVEGDLTANGLIRPGDQTRFTVLLPTDLPRFQYFAVTHSTPIGLDGLRLQLSAADLHTQPLGSSVKGDAVFGGVQLSYPLIRSFSQNLYGAVSLDALDSRNAAFGSTFSNSRTRALRGGLAYDLSWSGNAASLSATLSQGLSGLGARPDPLSGKADFSKLNLHGALDHDIGRWFVVRLRGAVQAAGGPVPTAEQFAFGGDEFGRAYPSAYALGDRAWAGSAEAALRPPVSLPALIKGSEVYGYVDGGQLRTLARGLLQASALNFNTGGGGVRLALASRLVLGLEAAKPLNRPFPGADDSWRGIVSVKTLF